MSQPEREMQSDDLDRERQEMDGALMGFCALSENGLILEANLTAATLLGMNQVALVGQPLARFIDNKDLDIYNLHHKQILVSSEPRAYELRIVKSDSTQLRAQLVATVTHNDGESRAFHIYIRDISSRRQTEERLEQQNLLLNALINSPNDIVIFSLDRNACYTAFNEKHRQEMRRVWNVDIKIGSNLLEAMSDLRLREMATQSINRALNGEIFSEVQHQPGVNVFYEFIWNPIWQKSGNVSGATVFVRDITARMRAEAALQESEGRYRTLVDWSPEPFFVHRDGKLLFANPAAVKMLGATSAQDLIGKPFLDLVHPDFHQLVLARIKNMTENGVNASMVQMKFLKLNGIDIDVEIQGKSIIYDGERAIHGTVHDITERKRAEGELRTLSRAMEQSPVSIVITNRAGAIEYVNPRFEQATGYTRAEVAGKNPSLLKSGQTSPEIYQQIWAAITVGGEWCGELCNRRKDGELFWEFATISGVRGENGALEHYIAVKEDITERKRAAAAHEELEAQLRESQKMQAIGTLAGGIAHDFNNIIATIMGNTELARQDVLKTQPRALESLEEIRKAGTRASNLVQQILSFSRRQPTERKLTTLVPVVEESVHLLRATLPARVALDVHFGTDAPRVLADATQIEQVVINLVTNALHALRLGPGRIALRLDHVILDADLAITHPVLRALLCAHTACMVRLSVNDNGEGMDAATRLRIFDPFFTTKPVGEGTGLGLSVVHSIVQSHGGAVTVDSQPGKGATFTVYLPVAESHIDLPKDDSAVAVTPAPSIGGGQHILYIDDEESLVFLVTRMLGRHGFHIRGFTDQREALNALRVGAATLDLVVTDYNMPGMSGLDVAREVRKIRADLPVVVVSGFIDDTLRAQAEMAGVREIIFKANVVEDMCDAFVRLARKFAIASKST